jgi:hypothetical protein
MLEGKLPRCRATPQPSRTLSLRPPRTSRPVSPPSRTASHPPSSAPPAASTPTLSGPTAGESPYSQTARYARSVARRMSSTAPVDTDVHVSSSAARPPISIACARGPG